MSTTGKPRLLDHVRKVLRLHHYSIHTERAYCAWMQRYVKDHTVIRREDLRDGERKIEAFLTHLAIEGNVSPSTQDQAMNALVFLYKRVLNMPLDQEINAVRARRKAHVPVVLQREEVAHVIALMEWTPQLVAQLLYESGLRIMEALRLRVQDIDFGMKAVAVRSGKGDKDRVTTLSTSMIPLLKNQFAKVKAPHEADLAQGHGEVYLPHALARKYPGAGREWGWQYVFPARHLSEAPRTGVVRRHHVDASVINKAIGLASRKVGLAKRVFNYVRNESVLPQRVRELAMLTTARAEDCPYIWNAHAPLGRQAGLRDALIDALRDRMPLPPMAVEEAVVIKLGMEFFQTNRISQETFDVGLTQFGPQGLVELTTLPDVTAMRPILSIFIPGVCGAPFGLGGKRSTLKHPPFATSIRLANIS
jgi:integron integrase